MTYKLLTAALAKPVKVDVGGGFDGGPKADMFLR